MVRINDILDRVSAYNAGADLEPIKKAYVFAAKKHQGQTRRSGEPYLIHPLEVAYLVTEMHLDVPSIVAALLHDTVEDTATTLEEVEEQFGAETCKLVDGVTKLSKIRFSNAHEKQAENFRKMVMAMAEDIRVILVKLADRVHNMRTLEHLAEPRRLAIAQETMDIYAPIANRLGMQHIKVELEDCALKHLKPGVYQLIDERLQERKKESQNEIEQIIRQVEEKLKEYKVPAKISGRMKHVYSIYRKMEKQNIPFDEVHDVVAFRIIVDTLPQCYETLGVIHSMWRPVPGRFKDYIAMPKANNYQSLHTTVIGAKGERVEFQIRTQEMHDIAEHGIAAHWKYKEGKLVNDKDEMKFKWVRRLLRWQQELSDSTEFLDTVKLDLFVDEVYVFTPKGDLREFPRGATPVDFAYSVHTDVGSSCVGAKVNGKIVPLRYKLRSGDTVEVICQKQKRPHKDWLQFVVTSRAKAKIRQHFRIEEHDQSSAIGRGLIEKICDRMGVSVGTVLKSEAVKQYAANASYDDIETLLSAVGYGKVSAQQIVNLATGANDNTDPVVTALESSNQAEPSVFRKLAKRFSKSSDPVRVSGLDNMLINFGKCCNPVVGDPIVGFITRGRGVSVHVADCPRVIGLDPERRIDVEWDSNIKTARTARLQVVCVNRPGLLAGMTEAITSQGVNIAGASVRSNEDQTATNVFDVEIQDLNQLRKVLKSLENIKGVLSVTRVRGM